MTSPTALVLGLDGATLTLVRPWAEAGLLPNLAQLMRSGSYGVLRSTVPATTPVAWPSIYTGTNPGKHGLIGFQRREPDTYEWRKVTFADLRQPPVWDVLAREGLRSAILFVPFTFPASAIDGVIVTGRGGPRRLSSPISYPPDLAARLASRFDDRALFGPNPGEEWSLQEIADALVDSVTRRTDAIEWVLSRESFDFVFTVWDQTDTVAHLFWHFSEFPLPDRDSPVFRVYEAVDHAIGRLVEACGDPLVAICSDHGTHPVEYKVRMPLWLAAKGLLTFARPRRRSVLQMGGRVWRRLPTPVRSVVPLSARRRVATSVHPSTQGAVDWKTTTVYPQAATAEALYLNLAGREPQGIVRPEDADAVAAQISDQLHELETPDGRRVVERIMRNDDIYHGDCAGLAPDLVVETTPGTMFTHAFVGDADVITRPARPDLASDVPKSVCYHDSEGLLILSGPGVKPGQLEADVVDVTPTLLRYMGCPYPRSLDGQGIEAAFSNLASPQWSDAAETTTDRPAGAELTKEEEADIERHLQDLGYLE